MRKLFVIDIHTVLTGECVKHLASDDDVFVFSLTSKNNIVDHIHNMLESYVNSVTVIHSAKMINQLADGLRMEYINFIGRLPTSIDYGGMGLKEWFALDSHASLWWMSLVQEKNTFKSDAFNKYVQFSTIIEMVKKCDVESVLWGASDLSLQQAFRIYAKESGIRFIAFTGIKKRTITECIRYFNGAHYIKHVIHMVLFAVRSFLKFRKIQRLPEAAPAGSKKTLMLVTPFPYYEQEAADQGIFRNKFYGQLQESITNGKSEIQWVAIYVQNDSVSINEAIKKVKAFIQNGNAIVFVEQFYTLRTQYNAFKTMLKQGLRFLKVQMKIKKCYDQHQPGVYQLFLNEWYGSFAGTQGYQAVLFYEGFKSLLGKYQAKLGVYCCEMHAWEKALIEANHEHGSPMLLYGYQHASISRYLLNYFNSPIELEEAKNYPLSRPDKLICNGQLPYGYMKESGWTENELAIAEAVRFNDLKQYMDQDFDQKENIVLVAFSIGSQESSSILNIVYDALKNVEDVKVWIKPHPFGRTEEVFNLSEISMKDKRFEIKYDPIEQLLLKARIGVVGESSVSLCALSLGCEVVVVNVPEWISMSPLSHIHAKNIRKADSADELRQIVEDILKVAFDQKEHSKESREIINQFFYLNRDSDVPEKFLELLKV